MLGRSTYVAHSPWVVISISPLATLSVPQGMLFDNQRRLLGWYEGKVGIKYFI